MSDGMVVTARPGGRTQLLDEWDTSLSRNFLESVEIEEPESTGTFILGANSGVGYPIVARCVRMGREQDDVVLEGGHVRIILVRQPNDVVVLNAPYEQDFTVSPSAPMFGVPIGTGEMMREIRDSAGELWRHYMASAPPITGYDTATVLDIPAVLQRARSRAGLPVQDLAAMFGIKRRQFYNLISGEQNTDVERELRIARVTELITKLSELVGGNSRKVRALLLARLDGDSIYDAAVADNEDRLGWALERAYSAAATGAVLPPRLAPSNRATPSEAAAVREFVRSTRDDSTATDR